MKYAVLTISALLTLSACTAKTPTQTIQTTTPSASSLVEVSASPVATISSNLTETFSTDLYTIKYEKGMKAESPDKVSSRIYKMGPTQRGQTEMYDGVAVTLWTEPNNTNQKLMDYVTKRIESEKDTSHVTVEPATIMLNGNEAVKYRSRGLGEYDIYTLQSKDKKTFITISVLAEDPTNKGFAPLAQSIVNTFTLK